MPSRKKPGSRYMDGRYTTPPSLEELSEVHLMYEVNPHNSHTNLIPRNKRALAFRLGLLKPRKFRYIKAQGKGENDDKNVAMYPAMKVNISKGIFTKKNYIIPTIESLLNEHRIALGL